MLIGFGISCNSIQMIFAMLTCLRRGWQKILTRDLKRVKVPRKTVRKWNPSKLSVNSAYQISFTNKNIINRKSMENQINKNFTPWPTMLINSRTEQYKPKKIHWQQRVTNTKTVDMGTLLLLFNYFEIIYANIEFLKIVDSRRKLI